MDGLSAAASGIAVVSIAIQLADSVKKLHDFWSSVKDAPDEVRAFRKDLRLLSTILSKIEREENEYGTSPETLEVLENCKEQVASLSELVRNISPGFEAASRRARKWSALIAAFKKDRRLEFRDCLRETKITLILAQQSSSHAIRQELSVQQMSLESLTQDMVFLKLQRASQLHRTSQTVKTRSTLQNDISNHTTEVLAEIRQRTSRISNPVYQYGAEIGISQAIREATNRNATEMQSQVIAFTSNFAPLKDCISKRRQRCLRYQTSTISNIFGKFDVISQTDYVYYGATNDDEIMENEDQYEHTTTIHIHPSQWLIKLGLGDRIKVAAKQSSQGLSHSLQSFYAVPDDSPIFDFCSKGDIKNVQRLLGNREATPWDADSLGRIPLHFAAEIHNPELCKLLLNAGSSASVMALDRHVIHPCYRYSPLLAAARSCGHKLQDQIDTLRLFTEQFDFSDDGDTSGWHILFHLLDSNTYQSIPIFSWAVEVFHSDITNNLSTSEIGQLGYFSAVEDTKAESLLSILNLGWPTIECMNSSSDWRVVHDIVSFAHKRDLNERCRLLKMFISKGVDLHTVREDGRDETPTSLAMRSSDSFHHWRVSLQSSAVELDKFVEREIKVGHLTQFGWETEALYKLFEHDIDTVTWPEECGLCGAPNSNSYPDEAIHMEVAWQKKLKDIRRVGTHESFDDIEGRYNWRAKFWFLCLDCWENGSIPKGWVSDDGLSETDDEASDSDSPVFLSI